MLTWTSKYYLQFIFVRCFKFKQITCLTYHCLLVAAYPTHSVWFKCVTEEPKKMSRKIKSRNTVPLQCSRCFLHSCNRPVNMDFVEDKTWCPTWSHPWLVRLLPGLVTWNKNLRMYSNVAADVQWPWLRSDTQLLSTAACLPSLFLQLFLWILGRSP